MKIRLSDWGKLLVMLSVIVSVTTLALADKVSGDVAIPVTIAVLGYVAGNGVTAIRKKPPSPVVGDKKILRQLHEIRTDTTHAEPAAAGSTDPAAADPPTGSSS